MHKIKFITDIASDLPTAIADQYHITQLSLPITVQGKELSEAEKLDPMRFYEILETSPEIPKTSQVPIHYFQEAYEKAYEEGYTHIIGLFLPSFASGTYNNACFAKAEFYREHPDATDFIIELPDSRTYSLGYGYPILEGAKMAAAGAPFEDILTFTTTWLSELEIYFTLYTLEHARKSGRIGVVSAMVGEALGLKTIVRLKDGEMKVYRKVRGKKAVTREMVNILKDRIQANSEYILLKGNSIETADEVSLLVEQTLGYPTALKEHSGAIVAINTGPDIMGMGFRSKRD